MSQSPPLGRRRPRSGSAVSGRYLSPARSNYSPDSDSHSGSPLRRRRPRPKSPFVGRGPTPDLLFSAHPPEHYSLSICRLCGESVPERSVRRHTAFCEAAHAGISGAGAVDRRVAAVAQALAGEAAGVSG
eukprot:TRINITY_DN14364_c2_g2_i2.p2 TRINITY_DN14364_c2_g2~~TRINITY_DN14364_c2_g2_i2.p2  ORF type:complete len:130 (-),score=7.09 TRINITY_DN14364_c2_g2_i2:84-473(-)